MPQLLHNKIESKLASLAEQSLLRQRNVVECSQQSSDGTITVDNKRYINFSSNDYLGLASHYNEAEALGSASHTLAVGSGASPIVTGYQDIHRELEQELCKVTGHEAAILFSSGFSANHGLITGLLDENDYVIADKLVHASIIDGLRHSAVRFKRFVHNHIAQVEKWLSASEVTALITESVFSMDGDKAPLSKLSELCNKYDVALIVDDAHGFGVLNQNSAVTSKIANVQIVTFGKALGCQGAAVLGSQMLIDYLVNHSRDYIYSTGLSPLNAAIALAAVKKVCTDTQLNNKLQNNIKQFRELAKSRGIQLMDSETPIQGVVIGDPKSTLQVADELKSHGVWCGAIRTPTVPKGTDRLRITITASHSQLQIESCVTALSNVLEQLNLCKSGGHYAG
ncbi:8-amino-7-oxononanoate synthase [Shewanella sp. 202IG2-18]|uniref:aminotransferase class I/II-fold pyridoxal phosphate-dependent enzyme n=1 Tax=Parashewanella hymeniacidonis TaxID=2807618 RepID=UPI0019618990|nr:8-amino-7-oxononanoate synthase [Parashewanella hymeniacidonis]MBM7070566.1 8-amino-7-oxononanoate synthase [Parashewanella hymeniacidonis]